MNNKLSLVIIFSILFLGMSWIQVSADSIAPPSPYTVVTKDGKSIFVMYPEYYLEYYQQTGQFPENFSLSKNSISKLISSCTNQPYPKSGLYAYNICSDDGSDVLLWSVNWYSKSVDLSDDGKYLVRYGPWATLNNFGQPNTKELAVAFYKEGRLLSRYSVGDLVRFAWVLPTTVSHFMWQKETFFDSQANQLTITTLNGEKYVFDITSGEIIEKELPLIPVRFVYDDFINYKAVIILLLLAGIALVITIFGINRFKNGKS